MSNYQTQPFGYLLALADDQLKKMTYDMIFFQILTESIKNDEEILIAIAKQRKVSVGGLLMFDDDQTLDRLISKHRIFTP